MKQRIGLNMYSLRELCASAADLRRTFGRVAEAGYRYVQISGIRDVEPAVIAEAMKDSGLKACATHLGWEQFVGDVAGVIELHELYGTNHTAVGGLPPEYRTREGIERFAAEAGAVLPRIHERGMDFSYHNHNHELARIGGSTWLDLLGERTRRLGVKFEIDVYWIAAGGGDPAEYVDRYSKRMSIVHVKDMCMTPEREQRFAPVGSGNLNWGRIFEAIRASPIEFVIVEQDSHYGDDPVANVRKSLQFLREAGFAQE